MTAAELPKTGRAAAEAASLEHTIRKVGDTIEVQAVGPLTSAGGASMFNKGKGAALRQAVRDKALQDLVYRSEYLASLACLPEERGAKAPPVALAATTVPELVSATVGNLQSKTWPQPASVVPTNSRHRNEASRQTAFAEEDVGVYGATENLRARLEHFGSAGKQVLSGRCSSRGSTRAETPLTGHQSPVYLRAKSAMTRQPRAPHTEVGVANAGSCLDPLHGRSTYNEVLDLTRVMADGRAWLTEQIPRSQLGDPFEFTQLPGGPQLSLLATDYVPVAKQELQEHARRCLHVELLDGTWTLDPSSCGMPFARFFWKQSNAGSAEGGAGGAFLSYESPSRSAAEPVVGSCRAARFLRLDGQDDYSADKFSLMEGGSSIVRQEASDPFRSRAVLVVNEPAILLAQGQYFELQVMSVFNTPGRADRPRDAAPRRRTEGLSLGFTTRRPGDLLDRASLPASDRSIEDVPMSWSVVMSGCLNQATGAAGKQPVTAAPKERILEPPSWQRRIPVPQSARGVKWPPTGDESKATVPRRLHWSAAVGAGDRVGLLVTTFGGLVVFVNGRRELMVPDAAVKVDEPLYPIAEAYNHVRSIRLLPGALPPP
eukprot:TRINITY_DN30814_c0_g1_i1.p1 TRINITY_DN30814_c0_g1~~TRINITY_DN30814_c0_g1_i1.p1  ORF type:complete len:601 (+),score=114.16 TRINITY_DN30814_c0_g1_i1:72-1874(+)